MDTCITYDKEVYFQVKIIISQRCNEANYDFFRIRNL